MPKKYKRILLSALFAMSLGCATRHEVDVKPFEVKPIHITIDVNIRVDRALDDFFGDIDKVAEKRAEEEKIDK